MPGVNEDTLIDFGVIGPITKDEYYSVELKKKAKDPFILYWRIGKMMPKMKNGIKQSLDVVMENLSKNSHWLFWKFNRIRDEETNIVNFTPQGESEKKKVMRAYKELSTLGFILRKRRQQYLCNPSIFIVRPGFQKVVMKEWNLLQTKRSN